MSLEGSEGAEGRPSVLDASTSASRLASYKRRATLSGWLASKAGRAVRAAVVAASAAGGREALLWALLHLVAGHQLGPAAALAAAAGDARLAVLLSVAGRHGAISSDIARQLQVRHACGLSKCHALLFAGPGPQTICLVPNAALIPHYEGPAPAPRGVWQSYVPKRVPCAAPGRSMSRSGTLQGCGAITSASRASSWLLCSAGAWGRLRPLCSWTGRVPSAWRFGEWMHWGPWEDALDQSSACTFDCALQQSRCPQPSKAAAVDAPAGTPHPQLRA
jgi:hypothetical protein